jgi:hypothetical protein
MFCGPLTITVTLVVLGLLMVVGIVMVALGSSETVAFSAEFRAYNEANCTIRAFKSVEARRLCSTDDDDDCSVSFIGLAGVTSDDFANPSIVYPAARQVISADCVRGKCFSTTERADAVNQTFGTEWKVNDTVLCGISPTITPTRFEDVRALPVAGLAAFDFNREAAESLWRRPQSLYIAGGVVLSLSTILMTIGSVWVYCRSDTVCSD